MSMLTIVTATYNRPASLRLAIRSALLQTLQDWRLIVVGDACDARTAAVIEEFGDERITYINLPVRCGEQAVPNSIGMALADSEFIALLNHDDVMLADHLERAVANLKVGQADFFAGKAAFARFSARLPDGTLTPVFSEVTPAERKLRDVFCHGSEMFEPCSAWVFRRSVFETVGPWRASARLYRTPMDDWLLRAWRAGINVVQDSEITVLRFLTHYQADPRKPAYTWDQDDVASIERSLMRQSPDQMRSAIWHQMNSMRMASVPRAGFGTILLRMLVQLSPEQEWLAERLLTPDMADVYLRTGWDAYDQFCELVGIGKGQLMQAVSRLRTGEDRHAEPDFEALLAFARQRARTGS
jgi:hypothetical protein